MNMLKPLIRIVGGDKESVIHSKQFNFMASVILMSTVTSAVVELNIPVISQIKICK